MERTQKLIKFTLNKGAYTMTAISNVIHLSYKLHPWGYPWKWIRLEREGKQMENFPKLQETVSFKHSSVKNLTIKFIPPLSLFFFPED